MCTKQNNLKQLEHKPFWLWDCSVNGALYQERWQLGAAVLCLLSTQLLSWDN